MSEKKYTQEEIRAIVDEAFNKAKLNARRELNLDEVQTVSGGNQYFDADGNRILKTGEPYCIETAEKYAKEAMSLYEITGNWDVPETFLDDLGFSLNWGELRNDGIAHWLEKVRGTYGGY